MIKPPLTGSEALSLSDIATIASDLIGRPITRTLVTDQEYRKEQLSHGLPEWRADLSVGLFKASRRGEFATVEPTLERLLGRKLVSMRKYLVAPVSKA